MGSKFQLQGFLGRKIWQVFLGWLDLSRDFLGIPIFEQNLKIRGSAQISSANNVHIQFLMFLFSCYIFF